MKKTTGFGNGLYSAEEQNPETYSQKETKIIYLKKMIDLVQLMTKQELAVKPNKVVAGLEPEYTNVFLQGSNSFFFYIFTPDMLKVSWYFFKSITPPPSDTI